MPEYPPWVDILLDGLEGYLEQHSPGSFQIRLDVEDLHLLIAPSLVEFVGGADDGEVGFPFFIIHLPELFSVFDEVVASTWNTMHDELSVEGEIDGEIAWVTIRSQPFDDVDEASEVWDRGSLRKKRRPSP